MTPDSMTAERTTAERIRVQRTTAGRPAPGGMGGDDCRDFSCPHCGGSGTLRLGGQRYRTCLPCLGQGQTRTAEPAIITPGLSGLRAGALLEATELPLSAAACAAAAR